MMAGRATVNFITAKDAIDETGIVYFGDAREFFMGDDCILQLTARESELFLFMLSASPGRATLDALVLAVYGNGMPSTNIIQVFLTKMRKKLNKVGLEIHSSGHSGYRYIGPKGVTVNVVKPTAEHHSRCRLCRQLLPARV